jgi:hypothetical protein
MRLPFVSVFRIFVSVLTLSVTAAVATVYEPPYQPARAATERAAGEELPLALERHLERLRPIPGNGGESPGGRGGAEAEKFFALAYPQADVTLAQLSAARSAATRLHGKPFPTGKGRPGTWITIGPSQALYPATEFRNSFGYVPARYVAGGRATAVAIDPDCRPGHCRLWVSAAGGGIWRTRNALSGQPHWEYLAATFGINSGSAITLDPNDPNGNTLYVGTGEANASGDSAAGVGLYKSTDGGNTFSSVIGASVFGGRAIGSIAVVPGSANIIYVATTRGVAGVTSVTGGAVTLIPGAAAWGLYKSTDGGQTWTFLHNGAATAAACDTVAEAIAAGTPCSLRGVRRVVLDPTNPAIVYAGSYSRGVWRSNDAGATWTQIKPTLANHPNDANMRPEIAVTTLPDGKTRMYVYEGSSSGSIQNPPPLPPTPIPPAQLFRSDDVATGAPVFVGLSSDDPANPGYATYNICNGQCWYDEFVYTPAGYPDIVYVGGSYAYGERWSNKRGVVLSTDAGVTGTDMTMDATDPLHPNGLHPDQHALVTNPSNPFQFFEVNDGGVMRSSGEFANVSWWCDSRGITGSTPEIAAARLNRCRQLLSRVPTELTGMNMGMTTLQFQSLSVSPHNVNLVQGGTQDNGTWQTQGNPVKWDNTMIGDGGQSGFDAALPAFRFHTFFNATPDVNFSHGDIADWNWIGDPFFIPPGNTELRAFYIPIISDPVVSRSMFAGLAHVWRTKTWGMGSMSLETFRMQCNEWFGQFTVQCGDWAPLGTPGAPGFLTGTGFGGDRTGGYVAAVERATSDTSTLWAATVTGRVFISKNADAEPATAVTFVRLDSLATNDPQRFVSGIAIDPANPNRAFVSYSGFNTNTPAQPGHVFEVTYDPVAGTATWLDRSYDLGDIPVTDVAYDHVRTELYASTDFGVFRLGANTSLWVAAAPGMPKVEVAGLTIVPGARRLYAATHGLGAWLLLLP